MNIVVVNQTQTHSGMTATLRSLAPNTDETALDFEADCLEATIYASREIRWR